MVKLVSVESPFSGKNKEEIERNIKYARACLRDCFSRGEFPFASHLLYTQPGILDDNLLEERNLGINAGKEWERIAVLTAVYTDLGISKGMEYGIERAKEKNRSIEYRTLNPDWEEEQRLLIKKSKLFSILTDSKIF